VKAPIYIIINMPSTNCRC